LAASAIAGSGCFMPSEASIHDRRLLIVRAAFVAGVQVL
jgi:hypothetical protein